MSYKVLSAFIAVLVILLIIGAMFLPVTSSIPGQKGTTTAPMYHWIFVPSQSHDAIPISSPHGSAPEEVAPHEEAPESAPHIVVVDAK